MTKKRIDTKTITTSALLVSMAIVWIFMFPTLDFGVVSVTLFSHAFIFVALFINPVTAAFTAIGTALAFMFKGSPVVVQLRAWSHLIFVAYAILYIEFIGINKGLKLSAFFGSSALLHGVVETIMVYLAVTFNVYSTTRDALFIWLTVCGVTILHSLFDSIAAYFVFSAVNGPLKLVPRERYY